jgi:hypothetical protein
VHGTTEKLPWPEEARQALAAYASTAQPPAADGESADR